MTVQKKVYGVLGYPLGHSWSAQYFEDKFKAESIHWASFHKFEYSDINEFIKRLSSDRSIHGFSVTMPYKEQIIPHLTTIHPTAEAIGAVNCVKVDRVGEMVMMTGYNTDVEGFLKSFNPPNDTHKAIILGTGGASKAVRYGLESKGYDIVQVSRQTGYHHYDDLETLIHQGRYINIINCTPVGMYPHTDQLLPLPYHLLTDQCYLYDLIYNPNITTFMQQGIQQHATVKGGLQMLHLQAQEAWQIWTH